MRLTFRCLVRPDLLLSTFAELIAYTKANPDKLNVGSSGMATPPHLMAEMLKACAGRSLRSVSQGASRLARLINFSRRLVPFYRPADAAAGAPWLSPTSAIMAPAT